MVVSFEHGSEPLGSIKCVEFMYGLRTCNVLKNNSASWS